MEIGVLVTGVGSGSTGEQVYKALRRGSRRYRIVVSNVRLEATVVAPDAERVQLPPAASPEYLPALAAAANRLGLDFIAPGSDPELDRIASAVPELKSLTSAVPLVNHSATIRLCHDKAATAAAVSRAGLRAPRTFECTSVAGALEAAARGEVPYPVVIKPGLRGGGSADVYVAQDAAELGLFAQMVLRRTTRAVVQEYVGDGESEYTVGVLHYPDGKLAGSFALRRALHSLLSTRLRVPNRTGRDDLGSDLVVSTGFSQGEVDDFPVVRAAAERLAGTLGSKGPLNVQGRLVGQDLVVFEVNPRFSGTEAMRAMAGWNGPEALIDWHLGVRPAIESYRPRRCAFVRSLVEFETEPTASPTTSTREAAARR
jgi:carbamoyl-phosphate synthase large subunit